MLRLYRHIENRLSFSIYENPNVLAAYFNTDVLLISQEDVHMESVIRAHLLWIDFQGL